MTDQTTKLPTSYWIIAIVGLVWNIMGLMNFIGQTFMREQTLASMTEKQQALLEAVPVWMMVVFGVAVFTGVFGCIGLLMKKSWVVPVFLISFICVTIQMIYNFVVLDFGDVMGRTAAIMMTLIFVIAAFLYFYSRKCQQKGWIS